MAEYKWATTHEWLREYISEIEKPHVFQFLIMELAGKLDSDDLQSIFDVAMSEDGYFDPLIDGIPLAEYTEADAWDMGCTAAQYGKLLTDNPFPVDSIQLENWASGYRDFDD